MRFVSLLPPSSEPPVDFWVDDERVCAPTGQTLAGALLSAGYVKFRQGPGGAHGPYCLMGACFECTVVVDGVGKTQACMIPVATGMKVRLA